MLLILVLAASVACIPNDNNTNVTASKAEENALNKIKYYYYDSNNNVVATASASEFTSNVDPKSDIDVVVKLNNETHICDCFANLTFDSADEEISTALRRHRDEIKRINFSANEDFLLKNDISPDSKEYEVISASYSPYVQLSFSEYSDYAPHENDVVSLAYSDTVAEINIGMPAELQPSAVVPVDENEVGEYPIADAIEDINATSQTYDGTGIKVGIIEQSGIVTADSHSELSSLDIYTAGGIYVDSHAVMVARILCGSNGVAPNVDSVYCYQAPSTAELISAMDWMIDNDVNVINACLSILSYMGQYHWTSALLDYYVKETRVTFVNAAGNTADIDESLLDPSYKLTNIYGTGYNVITVGATDVNNDVSDYSSYGLASGIYGRKPTLCAPGTNIKLSGIDSDFGTSYAAPMVTGVIAKLMDEFYLLLTFPEITMSALIVSATRVNGQLYAWDTFAGAGRVNYEKAREAVSNKSLFTYSDNSIGIRKTKTITVTRAKRIKVAAVWLVNSTTQSSTDEVLLNNHTNYDLRVAMTTGTVLARSESNTNIEYLTYMNYMYTSLVLQLLQTDARITSGAEIGAITWVYE